MFRTLSWREVEAVMAYAKRLHDGTAEPPESVTEIDAELAQAIAEAVAFKIRLRVTDCDHVKHIVDLMFLKDQAYLEAALGYMPSTAIH